MRLLEFSEKGQIVKGVLLFGYFWWLKVALGIAAELYVCASLQWVAT